MSAKDAPWIFIAALSVTIFIFWYMQQPATEKPPVTLQKEEDAAPAPPKVLFRRYHNWSAPAVDMFDPSDDINACESPCAKDNGCFGVRHNGFTGECGKLSASSFDPQKGVMGAYMDSKKIVTSMKDSSLKTDHMSCYGPYTPTEHPHRISPTQCPKSREAAINNYFKDIPAIGLFASLLPGGSTASNLQLRR